MTDAARPRRSACRCNGSIGPTWISAALPAPSPAARVRPGDKLARAAVGQGKRSRSASSTDGGDLDAARSADAVDHPDAWTTRSTISRGDVLARADAPPRRRPVRGHDRLDGRGADAARPAILAEARHAARHRRPSPSLKHKINVNTLEHLAAKTLELNEIGVCNLSASTSRSPSTLTREPRYRRLHPDRPADQRAPSAPA